MDDPYDVYVPGKLKLKKRAVDKTIKKKKKEKKKIAVQIPEDELEGVILRVDNRTEMEKRVEKVREEREAERIRKLAAKSYRERVEEYNTHLDGLSEHYDIPKVGPG